MHDKEKEIRGNQKEGQEQKIQDYKFIYRRQLKKFRTTNRIQEKKEVNDNKRKYRTKKDVSDHAW